LYLLHLKKIYTFRYCVSLLEDESKQSRLGPYANSKLVCNTRTSVPKDELRILIHMYPQSSTFSIKNITLKYFTTYRKTKKIPGDFVVHNYNNYSDNSNYCIAEISLPVIPSGPSRNWNIRH
jgi:hypothetical protein